MNFKEESKKLDLPIIIVPFALILLICLFLFLRPNETNEFFTILNPFFRDKMSLVYLFVSFALFLIAIFLSFSKYGNIVLGKPGEKPAFSFWGWGAMMFCCGMAADILYYGFTEWLNYSQEAYIISKGNPFDFSNVYSFFFWANFWEYLVVGTCFAFMMHVRNRSKQKYSEAIRPLIGKYADGVIGKIIDIFATMAIIAAVACSLTFTVPVITVCLNSLFGIPANHITTIVLLILICVIYSISLANGLRGIKFLSSICIYVFLVFILYVFLLGGQAQFILENTFKQIGLLCHNLFLIFTDIDPTRQSTFVQDYCVFYNAFWLTWAITVPFFIGVISRGRTIRQTILGGLAFAMPGSVLCFSVLSNYSESIQIFNKIDLINIYNTTGNAYNVISEIINTLPFPKVALLILIISMICFNATSFDSISLTCSYYSYKNLSNDEAPHSFIKQLWAILLILFPVALIFSEGTANNLQNVAVIFGFPGAILVMLVVISFFKDVNNYQKEKQCE
ncbi:MAG: BCCT family transporter [Lachnospiraceae bacterium]|nr:BCCT family transporter [Lachnospiraceae bacterium]